MRLNRDERDMQIVDRYLKFAKEAFSEVSDTSVSDVASKLAFLLAIAYSREKIARLLALTLAERACGEHYEAMDPC